MAHLESQRIEALLWRRSVEPNSESILTHSFVSGETVSLLVYYDGNATNLLNALYVLVCICAVRFYARFFMFGLYWLAGSTG